MSKIKKIKITNNYITKKRIINNNNKIILLQKNFKLFSKGKNLIKSIPKLYNIFNYSYLSNDIKLSSNKRSTNSNNMISESSNYLFQSIKELNLSGFITKMYKKNIISIKKENIYCFFFKKKL